MHRAILERHLAEAEQHLADGQAHIHKQRVLIEALEHRGSDSSAAKDLMATLQQTQQLHEQHHELVLRELREWDSQNLPPSTGLLSAT